MRHLFTFLLFLFIAQAQETLINETFETGWTADSNVIPAENEEGTPAANLKLQGWGDGFTFTVVNDAGNGANSSDYFAKMNRGGTTNYAVIQRLVEATSGDVYEYNISLTPDISGQAGSHKLEVVDLANDNNVATSTTHAKVFLIKSFDVIPGNRYRWTLETKVVNNGPAWKRTHVLTVVCGKGEESQQLVKENIAESKNGAWITSSLDFTVPQNKSEVTLQLFRFAEGTTVSVDNYKLVKL